MTQKISANCRLQATNSNKSASYPLPTTHYKTRKAFSLLELMIVIIILGLLSALVLPNLIGKAESAKRKLVCIQMKNIEEALKSFKFDNGIYPTTEEGLEALLKNPDPEKYTNYSPTGYLESRHLPKDPWKHRYIYINNGGEIELISLGADGKEGGEGDAKDITLKECERQ
ncbi:general secretion pathway protein G [Hydrogenimonas sp.]|nr:general secretion pathway protein G [Hydrogenimonas sp.]